MKLETKGSIQRLLAGISLACLTYTPQLHAQSAPADSQSAGGLEEIIVTAEKKSSRLQSAPSAVTAIEGSKLLESNIVEPADLTGFVPGLTIAKNEGYNRVVAIRGVGYETPQNGTAAPSVSYHVDGVFIPSPVALNADFLDVARIEVLRGPQGTVFGQNSTGGAINVVSNQPILNELGGNASLSYGSYNLVRFNGVANVPVTDTFAIRAAILQNRHDGFAKATSIPGMPNYELDNDDSVAARLLALWAPTDDLSITLGANYYDADDHDRAQKNIRDPIADPRILSQDYPGRFGIRSEVFDATIEYDTQWAVLKSITSWQYLKYRQALDNDRLTYALNPFAHDIVPDAHTAKRSITQEVDISSPKSDGPFDWIVGAFYLNTNGYAGFLEYQPVTPATNLVNAYDPKLVATIGAGGFETLSTNKNESFSFFGQGTYRILENLDFTGGVRYTKDDLTGFVSSYYAPIHVINSASHALTGRAELTFKITPDNNAYVSYSTGYKPGATNLENTKPILIPEAAKPEDITAYEIGSKNEFLDGTLRANFAAFYYDYNNFQFASEDPIPFHGGVDNLGNVRIYGLEGEFSAILPANFRLDTSLAWEHGKINSHTFALDDVVASNISNTLAGQGFGYFSGKSIGARVAAVQDLYGKSPPKLPKYAATVDLSHKLDLGDQGELDSRLELVYRSSFEYRVFNSPALDRVPSSITWNLNLNYKPQDTRWNFNFQIINLFDRLNVDSRFTNSFGVESTSQEFAPPRQFIARASYTF
jgi:iron complex outermembrane receptor protein